ncbi:MAG: hypothetical protein EXS13_11750 [Planctomycetes bacterium]|nr:hypothetical protein [Planctomycetota bacterium]
MNPPFGLTGSQLEDALPFCFVALFLTLVPLPAIVFKSARSWAKEQPQLGSAALAGAVTIVIVAIASVTLLILALAGWLPPPNQWARPS